MGKGLCPSYYAYAGGTQKVQELHLENPGEQLILRITYKVAFKFCSRGKRRPM